MFASGVAKVTVMKPVTAEATTDWMLIPPSMLGAAVALRVMVPQHFDWFFASATFDRPVDEVGFVFVPVPKRMTPSSSSEALWLAFVDQMTLFVQSVVSFQVAVVEASRTWMVSPAWFPLFPTFGMPERTKRWTKPTPTSRDQSVPVQKAP